jgi:hypothetical protein
MSGGSRDRTERNREEQRGNMRDRGGRRQSGSEGLICESGNFQGLLCKGKIPADTKA